jgi:hypothetical protein
VKKRKQIVRDQLRNELIYWLSDKFKDKFKDKVFDGLNCRFSYRLRNLLWDQLESYDKT